MAESGTRAVEIELPIVLDRDRGGLRRQLEEALRTAIRDGALRAGTTLPSTRTLAADLGVSRRLVVESYAQLAAEGYLATAPRSGTRVSELATGSAQAARTAAADAPWYDLRPGTPDLAGFPRTAWRRATTSVLRCTPDDALRYPDPRGHPELRRAVAAYVRRVRGVVCDEDRVVICSGVREALSLLAAVRRGTIGVEEPGLFEGAEIITAAGARVCAVPVDEDGLRTDRLLAADPDAVLVTPAHQFPTGVPLAAARRSELVAWARDGRLVIEDDYDAEYRYDRPPLQAVQGLAPDHVAYVGSVSKTLAPALRLGWLVLPPELVAPVTDAKRLRDGGTETLSQLALAHVLDSGDYDRHLRRARLRYRARRDALLQALRRHIPTARVAGISAGLHVLVTLPSGTDLRALEDSAQRRRLGITPVTRFYQGPADVNQLVVGYGNLDAAAAEAAVRLLAEAIDDAQIGPKTPARPSTNSTMPATTDMA
ncbi:MAG TPA: PLP-dependent aminotransferase family protein [Solirubrobacter sp.]|nr:PLP-dependent aminotransferase family protein [Solirubrobacter sp.]